MADRDHRPAMSASAEESRGEVTTTTAGTTRRGAQGCGNFPTIRCWGFGPAKLRLARTLKGWWRSCRWGRGQENPS